MKFNFKIIGSLLGILLVINGGFMLLCIPVSMVYQEGGTLPLIISAGISVSIGSLLWAVSRNRTDNNLNKRDGYLIVTLGWLSMSLVGTLPFLVSGAIPNFTNAFFETLSGFTTTGASILDDIESIPKGILFWRSLTQWMGGMGIIVLAVAILPILGIGGMQLFVAEAPGLKPDKLQPRITATARRLWIIYVGLTGLEFVLLWIGGMTVFDALNHSLTTMATGGFSTKQLSVAYYDSPYIQYVIIFFMFLAGTNFTLTYFGFKGNFKKVWANEEFRVYSIGTLSLGILVCIGLYYNGESNIEQSFRDALFQVVSVITTTGFVSADYTLWGPAMSVFFFMLMFLGASAGSTSGGVKIVRHLLLIKNGVLELKRQIHPTAIIPVRLNNKAVSQEITFNVLAFIMIYLTIYVVSTIIMGLIGVDFVTALGSVATSLGNIGPGFGTVGPVHNFAHIPSIGKWFLSFLMLLGRLELFTVLILITPYFWRRS
ncbi:MAG: potassium transporter [Cyclobacteriaceae bacterium]|nr:MAG: potassium transporter [Cyclobacteriaceae bacterium]